MSGLAGSEGMDALESIMWRVSHDLRLASTFGAIVVLDRELERHVLLDRIRAAVERVPRLRQRVVRHVPGGVPSWQEVTDIDFDYHLVQVPMHEHDDLRDVLKRVPAFIAAPFDGGRPLWQMLVFTGLASGGCIIVQRAHHAISDAENAVSLALQFVDSADDQHPRAAATPPREGRWNACSAMRSMTVAVRPDRWHTSPATIASRVNNLVWGIAEEAADFVRASVRPALRMRSDRRELVVTELELGRMLAAAHALGGTLNTLLLAACATAVSDYLEGIGRPVESLVCTIAISTRSSEPDRPNRFTVRRMRLPAATFTPEQRFQKIWATTRAASGGGPAAPHFAAVAAAARPIPTVLLQHLGRLLTGSVDMVTSNFRVSEQTLCVGGAKVLAIYPIGPLPGIPLNITMLSYRQSAYVGIHVDPSEITQPAVLRSLLEQAVGDLLAAAGSPDRCSANGGEAR